VRTAKDIEQAHGSSCGVATGRIWRAITRPNLTVTLAVIAGPRTLPVRYIELQCFGATALMLPFPAKGIAVQ
jgi:hypothetical protein